MRYAMLLVLTLFGASLCFGAEVYPSKAVRVIVAFGPSGTTDLTARLISQQLSEQFGKSFVVDNRPGASGAIGAGIVAKSAPDGYTLLMIEPNFSSLPGLNKSLPFDVVKDFTPITQIGRIPYVLVAHPSLNAPTLKDFIALARANPGKFNYGSTGVGSSLHLGTELFKTETKVNIVHIPYKGGGEVITAMLAGEVQMRIAPISTVLTYVNSGKVRALAVATEGKRVPSMPDVPSMSEAGVPGMAIYHWTGLIGPAGMRRNVVSKLHDEVVKATTVPSVKEWFIAQSGELVGSSPEEFSKYIRNEMRRWAEVIKSVGITTE